MNPANITIAVLDRNPDELGSLAAVLEDAGYRVLTTSTQAHIERFFATQPINLVAKGFDATVVDPLPFVDRIKKLSPDTGFILCGRGGTIHEAVQAIQNGASDYLPKPVDKVLLLEAVRKALERQAIVASDPGLRRSLRRQHEPDFFIGSSEAMRNVVAQIDQVGPANVPVLICGESGSGKELVARGLHAKSPRSDGPFVALNCAGLTDTLMESELFGHVRGAFTGAIHDRAGAFELAGHGTLFLDEIGDLSLKGQGDLLRVLEDGIFHPVGSIRPKRADVRVVAASNRVLGKLAASGLFREDLLYRLNIVELHVPPLRDRLEDIPALVNSFNRHFSARHGRQPKAITPEFLEALTAHSWPGNVRELRNLVERLVVTVRENELSAFHAPKSVRTKVDRTESEIAQGDSCVSVAAGTTLADAETMLIRATLAKADDNRAEAARRLGISRRALHYKLKRLGIE